MTYVRNQTAGELFRNAFSLYGKHFGIIVAAFALAGLPALAVHYLAQNTKSWEVIIPAMLLEFVATSLAFAAMITVISDICVGVVPNLGRAYRRMWRYLLPLLLAGFLQTVAVILGFALLILPGIAAFIFLMFVTPVVVLEHKTGFSALRRSASLVRNFFWRNFAVLAAMALLAAILGGLLGGTFFLVSAAVGLEKATYIHALEILKAVIQMLVLPLGLTLNLLMYYDLRVRKEAYDLEQLTQELQH